MAKADWGTKRNCFSCATKFYDFKRDPILCPSCGKELLLEKPARIKLNKNNNEKTSKDDLPEKETLEDDTKDDSMLLEDDIIDKHINVVSNIEELDNENDGIEVEIDQDDGFQVIEDDSNAIELEEVQSEKKIE